MRKSRITSRSSTDDRLAASEKRLADIIDFLPDATFAIDDGGKVIAWNRAIEQMTGVPASQMLGKGDHEYALPFYGIRRPILIDLVLSNDPDVAKTYNVIAGGTDLLIAETWVPFPGAKGAFLWGKATRLRDAKGCVIGAIESIRDITERKRAEAQLRYQAALVENMSDAVISVDTDVIIRSWNKAAEKIYGWMAQEIIGRPLTEIFRTDNASLIYDIEKELRRSGIWRGEIGQRRRDGTELIVFTTVTWIWGEAGKPTGVMSVNHDVTAQKKGEAERSRLEEQLLQAQKMESIGRLAAGVSHDLNNLLAPIIGFSELLLMDLRPGDAGFEDLQQIEKAAESARDLTRQLLAYGRRQLLSIQAHDLRTLVEDLKPLLRRAIREDLAIIVKPSARPLMVLADASQMQHVLINLAVNAQDAIVGAGTITIEMHEMAIDEVFATMHPGLSEGDYAVLAVSDTGMGMDLETQRRIFEPFFTTKPKGKGTGLGLATVFGIVKQHGGHISVSSDLGKGSTFRIYLPLRSAEPPSTPLVAEGNGANAFARSTVLVVEDNGPLRDVTVKMLARLGYKALPSQSPKDALEMLARSEEAIDLVLTDVVMPGMSGNEMYARIATIRPGMKVLYMSGYTEDTIAHHGVLDQGVHFIQKPFSTKALAEKLREVLGERHAE